MTANLPQHRDRKVASTRKCEFFSQVTHLWGEYPANTSKPCTLSTCGG